MINLKFNIRKTTQAAAEFLKRSNNEMNYMKLIKLLYLADRESLRIWERPISDDSYFSMPRGPILSSVLDLISHGDNPNNPTYWHEYISEPEHYKIKLIKDIESDDLSERELNLINSIYEKFKDYDQWTLVDYCHDNLPEWKHPGNTSIPIYVEDILHELDKTDRDIEIIEDEVDIINYAKKLLSC